eukprot:TRINITY_DN9627_c0_g1_i1.p1 TRINITY_DN9627_c0_g1~~TRINITY_DN9627_c0_g1_i1.p1  ORF type:complete len:408 (+),score=141.77 TRINITY_DN9627_c0_g1_i1:408-1631(+)
MKGERQRGWARSGGRGGGGGGIGGMGRGGTPAAMLACAVLATLVWSAGAAVEGVVPEGADVYVSPGGVDEAGCGVTPEAACKSLAFALTLAVDGGTVMMAPGTYKAVKVAVVANNLVTIRTSSESPSELAEIDCGGEAIGPAVAVLANHTTMHGIAIRNCKNDGDAAGGVFMPGRGVLEISHCTFENNRAESEDSGGGAGGAVHAQAGTLLVSHSLFRNNSAVAGGGAIDCGVLVANSSVFSFNSVETNARGGGAVHASSVLLYNTTVSNNFAISGGGLLVGTSVVMVGGSVSDNRALLDGGGMRCEGTADCSMSLDGVTLSSNHASRFGGGVSAFGRVDLSECTFEHNSAYEGAALHSPVSDLAVRGGSFSRNRALTRGGALMLSLSHSDSSSGGVAGGQALLRGV